MKKKILIAILMLFVSFLAMMSTGNFFAKSGQSQVDVGSAGNFVILAKTGISTTGNTSITGNIGVSPIDSTAITGFALVMDSTNTFSTSSLVDGRVYASDYALPTPSVMTTAISDMEAAYTDAAGRTPVDYSNVGSGSLGGNVLLAGVYKWNSGVTIATNITLSGSSSDVWIFQIAGNLVTSSSTTINLAGGALPSNVFWQVAGYTELGTYSYFNGVILDKTYIAMDTGATLNGRAFAQTAVTLDSNTVGACGETVPVVPTPPVYYTLTIKTEPCSGSSTDYGTTTPPVGVYTYQSGTNVTVTAHPSAGWYFDSWILDDMYNVTTNSNTITFTMNSDHVLWAIFNPIEYPQRPPTTPPPVPSPPTTPPPVIPSPPTTNVTLTVLKFCFKPVTCQYGDISPDVGTYTVPVGTNMTFTAIDDAPPFKFYSWNFNGQELFGNTITVTVTANSTLYAMFTAKSPLYVISPPISYRTGLRHVGIA